ncbi:hypothetical protein MAR_025828 [Mya arenaria]|uniref:Uncharacterized protein n=1 Tax=Mya arenaria TaxID=6604 RepID=A0ABY7ESW3_MYAAR|nr:hypothetical protein MAR_025828 [Mya arenaria]
MAEYVAKLGSNISSEEEVLTLQQLHSALSAINHNSGSDHNLTGVAEHNIELFGEGNPYHTASVNDLCPSQAILDRFTCYVFERRFGWSETDTEDGRRVRHMSCSGATMSAGSSKQKSALNTMLDCLLKWFLHQEMDLRLLQALKYTIAQTSNLPVICEKEESWQKKEGAIMGINAILQRFLNRSSPKSPMSSPRVLDAEKQERAIPEFISGRIQSVVFDLLSHSQLTIREHAAKTLATYITCSSVDSSHSVVILKLLLQALAMGWSPDTDAMTQECEPQSTSVGKPSPSVCQYTGSNLSDSWEGREGRMFAYELIFRYLIKNHWLYTFGPAGAGLHSDPAVSKDGPGGVSDHADVKNSTENELLSSTPNQFGMHHVESEKSLAVRFLTQTELKEDTGIVTHAGGRLGRLQSTETDQLSRSPHMSHSPGAGLGGGAGLPGGMGLAQYDLSCSLLTQAQLLEGAWQGAESNPAHTGVDRQETQLRRLSQLLENNNNRNSMCRCGWMEKEYLQDMSRILKVILYQTAECLGHAQWELRRIANQVLPCLGEVIRWYDINLLVSVWNSYLNVAMPTCLMTFTSVLLLKESVIHAVKLLPLLHKPPHSWQKFQHVHTVLKMWREIFHGAHPQTRISLELLHTDPSQPFQSPFEGYLSCCLVKPDNKTQCAKQVEKHLVTEMYNRFSVFVSSLPVEDRLSVTPILAHYIGQFEEDTHISKAMLDWELAAVITLKVGGENEDLSLLSNDIPATEPPSVDTSDSEEDLHAVGSPSKRFRESLTLNTSNNSGSLSGRLSSLSAHSVDGEGSVTPEGGSGDEETSSDWDSWDEEEEGQSAFGDTFAVFLGKLQKSSTRDFQAELKQLPIKQRTVILNLLKN